MRKIEELTLNQIIGHTGDAEFVSYQFSGGIAEIVIELDDLHGETVAFSIKTDCVEIDSNLLDSHSTAERICYLRLINLEEVVTTQHGIIVPPPEFPQFMQQYRKGLTTVYGRRLKDVPWLLQARSYGILFACPVSDLSHITWREVK